MQTLAARGACRGRAVCFVPRWLPEGLSPSGMPYKVFPVLSSMSRHGLAVDLFTEVHDGVDSPALRRALSGSVGAVAWCAELNPGVQIPGLLRFLELARELAPTTPRLAGGGFFYLLPERTRNLEGLADEVVLDAGVPSVAQLLCQRLGVAPGDDKADALDPYALRQLDLRPFVRPEAMLFGNEQPALQLPTGFGCAKQCAFCFYERTRVQLLDAERLVDTIADVAGRYGVRQFLFGELDFFTSRKRALDTARLLVERDLGIGWFALASITDLEKLGDDELDLLAASGCRRLELGTETGSDAALARIGKRYRSAAAESITRRLSRRGIAPLHNIMFGFVGETARDRRDTLALVRRLRAVDPRVRFNFRVYQAAPNTTMGDVAMQRLPALPASFRELAAYREAMPDGRAMPWLTAKAESQIKLLTDYLLPLAYGDALMQGRAGWRRRLLRRMAALRCRLGAFCWPVDRSLFQRLERVGLAGTFLP